MSERYGSSRPPRRDYDGRPRSSAQRPSGTGYNTGSSRTQGARPASRTPQSGRPASRPPQGARPVSRAPQSGRPASRPPQNGRRPAPRRRKKSPVPAIIAILVVIALIVGIIIIISSAGKNKGKDNTTQNTTPTVVTQQAFTEDAESGDISADAPADPADYSSLADYLDDDDAEIQGLSEEEMIQVSHLSINEDLPDEWMNILLLGTDERDFNQSARSDTMIICSINKNTGDVKLTSIMRDLAVELDELGKNSGTYRINAANYFGGPEYAMKIVNECFGMNIQHYVSINFFGFQEIAHALGGITVDITEAEMVEINRYVWSAYVTAQVNEIDDSAIPLVELTQFGEDTKLDGRQTLAYARIRKTDSDYARAGRQREVLGLLAEQLKTKSPAEITMMLARFTNFVRSNLEFDEAASIAMKVLQEGDLSEIGSFRLPVNGSFNQTSKNNKSMFYDCDWALNSRELYTFIYG